MINVMIKSPQKMKPLQVMKFGGTSVGDASCIARVAEIIRGAAGDASVAVVVSAMSGVTNLLIEAANQARTGNASAVAEIFVQLGKKHDDAVTALIHSAGERRRLQTRLHELLGEGERLCQDVIHLRELTPRTLDAISGLGERLSAPIVAGALAAIGVSCEAIDATELIVTDSCHGAAEPSRAGTRARCQARVAPLFEAGIVPVVTGFLGATEEGVPTTLGRGGSDYSATLLAAALDADEVVIWTDVPGLLTADPKLVPEARTIPEISYREAAESAYFGAKVLHPKTLRPVMQRGIPVWIKDTFASGEAGTQISGTQNSGTKITPNGPRASEGVKALAAISNAVLITVAGVSAVRARCVRTAAAVGVELLLIVQSPLRSDIGLVIPAAMAERTVEALRHEFSREASADSLRHEGHEGAGKRVLASAVSVITLVGQSLVAQNLIGQDLIGPSLRTASAIVARTLATLQQENIEVLAAVPGSSDCSISFVIPQPEMKAAAAAIHRELELGTSRDRSGAGRRANSVAGAKAIWKFQSEPANAD